MAISTPRAEPGHLLFECERAIFGPSITISFPCVCSLFWLSLDPPLGDGFHKPRRKPKDSLPSRRFACYGGETFSRSTRHLSIHRRYCGFENNAFSFLTVSTDITEYNLQSREHEWNLNHLNQVQSLSASVSNQTLLISHHRRW